MIIILPQVWPILSEQKTKDTGYYVNSFNSTYPSLVPPPNEKCWE